MVASPGTWVLSIPRDSSYFTAVQTSPPWETGRRFKQLFSKVVLLYFKVVLLWQFSYLCKLRCVVGRELFLRLERQTIRQLLSGWMGKALLRNSIGIELLAFQNNLLIFYGSSFIPFDRTRDLASELNFHLTEYQTGRLGKLDEVAEPSRQV